MNKQKWRVPKEPVAAKQVAELRELIQENTDSKTILWALNFVHGFLLKKKKTSGRASAKKN